MARLISRQEAASLLEVTNQTVSNWVENGLLTGHMIDGRLLVDRQTIVKNFDTLQQLGQTQERAASLYEQVWKEERDLDTRLMDITKASVSIDTGMPRWLIEHVYSAVISVAGEDVLTEREASILYALNAGNTLSTVSEKFGLTRERVLQIVKKCFRKIYSMRTFSDLRREIKTLRSENSMLQRQVDILYNRSNQRSEALAKALAKYGGPAGIHKLTNLFSERVRDLDFTVRAINCMTAADIDTVADLVQCRKEDILKFRNFGKKSMRELDSFLESNGLSWGMDVGEIFQLNIQLSKAIEHV